jgi:hypothetical protein
MTWHALHIDGVAELAREVAVFRVSPRRDDLPMVFRVKIVERQDGAFEGHPEIALKGADGEADWIAGSGATIEAALADTVAALLRTIEGKTPISDDSVEWSKDF